ncbi:MAG: Fis family transcriptional regulator, partial [Alphaproteobacteria bacterium]|nr:Fis family transcriptional regulator [Alphaproteobacteria bacterium]
GTLFLDEIGTLTLPAQGKLLRALQEREIERVGDGKTRSVDVRVVAATNEDLRDCVRRGLFREDLFYRLNVFPIRIPPLRERRADIPLLMDYFLKQFCERHSKSVSGFTQRAIHALFSYEWRGNVRELENVIERGVILVPDAEPIDVFHLFTSGERLDSDMLEMSGDGRLNVYQAEPAGAAADMQVGGSAAELALDRLIGAELSLDDLEEELLHAAVRKAGGNVSEGARLLGITRPQLDYRLKKSAQSRAARG